MSNRLKILGIIAATAILTYFVVSPHARTDALGRLANAYTALTTPHYAFNKTTQFKTIEKVVTVPVEKIVIVEKEVQVPYEVTKIVIKEILAPVHTTTLPVPTPTTPTIGTFARQIAFQTPTPTPTRRPPTPTPRPRKPTPLPIHDNEPRPKGTELHALHIHMLNLINAERTKVGVPPVTLGFNKAAQKHAEDMLTNCFSSHWNLQGMKPNHRYALAGGTGTGRENVQGNDYCITKKDNYRAIQPSEWENKLQQGIKGLMQSPGHRKNMLDPAHTLVTLGIAFNRYNATTVQQFSSDYVRYSIKPKITNAGVLRLRGTVKKASSPTDKASFITIYYHPPLKPLTRGQVARTYSTCLNIHIASPLEPLLSGGYYTTNAYIDTTEQKCVNPYDLGTSLPPPTSADEAHDFWTEAKRLSQASTKTITNEVLYITANHWEVSSNSFYIRVDLEPLLQKHGPGVYSIIIWGQPDHMTKTVPLSEQPIFWQTSVP